MRLVFSLNLASRIYIACLLILFSSTAFAEAFVESNTEPYVPDDDSIVLETLKLSQSQPELIHIRKLQQSLARDPDNAQLAATIAHKYIVLARKLDDPRYYGYAQATLKNWWHRDRAPATILMMRATIKQHFHLFDQALSDLTRITTIDPDNSQAWLTKAIIEQVTGHPEKALKSCRALIRLADPVVTTTCLAGALSLQGHATVAYNKLRKLMQSEQSVSINEKVWVLTTMAEIAQRLGHNQQAKKHFQSALALNDNDSYLITSFTDYLILNHQYKNAHAILKNKTSNNAHLLRLILTEKALGEPELKQHTDLLQARYQADAERGSKQGNRHLRDQARFYLEVKHQPKMALSLARLNWKKQKEPDDLMILLKTAMAANSKRDMAQAVRWIEKYNLQDARLTSLQNGVMM